MAVAHDSSGNGNDLTYSAGGQVAFGIPGYVTVDAMVQLQIIGPDYVVASGPVSGSFLTGGDLFFVAWTDGYIAVGTGGFTIEYFGNTVSSVRLSLEPDGSGNLAIELGWTNVDFSSGGNQSVGGIPPGPHMYGARYARGADKLQFYVDGAPWGSISSNAGVAPNIDTTGTLFIGTAATTAGSTQFFDEMALGGNPTTDADFANLYAARANFATYTAVQLSMGPQAYYHLDEFSSRGWYVGQIGMTD